MTTKIARCRELITIAARRGMEINDKAISALCGLPEDAVRYIRRQQEHEQEEVIKMVQAAERRCK